MGDYGPYSRLVERIIEEAASLSIDQTASLYRGRAGRLLRYGSAADKLALAVALRAAALAGLEHEYVHARHAAATAFRGALPAEQGPWLVVGQAIANAAGAVVISGVLDRTTFDYLIGPWRQAVGTQIPVGPGMPLHAAGRGRLQQP